MDDTEYLIGALAARTGVTRDTVRYYEEIGIMPEPARTASGYRIYDSADLERLRFIRQARDVGLTLEDIGEVLSLVEEGRTPCDHVRARLASRLEETRSRIRELRRLEARLEETLGRAERAGRRPPGCRCHIIEEIPAGTPRRGGPPS